MVEVRKVVDSRLGNNGIGIFVIPFGALTSLIAFFVALQGVFSSQLLGFDSVKLIFICGVLVFSSGFLLLLFFGACKIFSEARYVLQRIEIKKNIEVKTFLGSVVSLDLASISSVQSVNSKNSIIPMSLLSRSVPNWRLKMSDGREYFINGEVENVGSFMSNLAIEAEVNSKP